MSGSEKTRDCFCECKITHKKRMFLVGFFVIGVMAAGQALTNEKMPEETKVIVQEVVNPHILRKAQIAQEEMNPLLHEVYTEIDEVVEEYYRELAKEAKFVECYDDVSIYTKLGPYEHSYIVFAYYEMKIKDINTKIPGLGTLYLEEDEKGELSLIRHVKDENVNTLVRELMQHQDVQALTSLVKERYTAAFDSDIALREAVRDLRKAYETSPLR